MTNETTPKRRELNDVEYCLEAVIHVHLLMAVEECQTLLLWYDVDLHCLKSLHQDDVLSHARRGCQFEGVAMQVQRMGVGGAIGEGQAVAGSFAKGPGFVARVVILAIDGPTFHPIPVGSYAVNQHGK